MSEESFERAAPTTRRQFMGASALAGAGLLLSACGGGSGGGGGGGGGGGKVTLQALHQQQAGYSADDIKGMTDAFMKANPNIKVENTLVAYEALHDKIVAAAPSGTYDVVLMDCIWPAEFASKHLVVDLTSRVKSLSGLDNVFPGAIGTAEYQNKYYGMPWLLDTKYLFYNTAMLKQAGVDPKQLGTWDGVRQAAAQLKSKGVV